jgi:hypothetical protein
MSKFSKTLGCWGLYRTTLLEAKSFFSVGAHLEEIGKIHISQKQANGWHEDVVHKRLDNSPKGRADDNAYSQNRSLYLKIER